MTLHADSGGCDAAVHILLRLQLMPDKENWAWMVAVEIPRGILGTGGCGGGFAWNTGSGWWRWMLGRGNWRGCSWWRSGMQGTLVMDGRGEDEEETRRRRRKEERREGEGRRRKEKEKEATNIKSNNPHLAGGEK